VAQYEKESGIVCSNMSSLSKS